jgi:hypothetical protein
VAAADHRLTTTTLRTSQANAPAPRTAVPLLGLALAALATVVWSGSFVTSRALHDSVPPVQQAFWRWLVALAAVAPFGARQAWRQRRLIRRHLGLVLLASLLGVTGYNTLVNQAGLTTPAATMGMIMAASPVNRGTEQADGQGARRGPEHEALGVWVGRWINEGHMIDDDGSPGQAITTSDVYEWAPGGFFLVHSAYGGIGEFDVGGTEIIGYDETSGAYTSHFFDSQGNVTVSSLVARGDTWTYQGATTRSTVEFGDGHRVQTVLHERTDDGTTYRPAMKVTLVKVG